MPTLLDIVDTAVKIGLGALISGVATYKLTKLNHQHELQRIALGKRRELLEAIATQLVAYSGTERTLAYNLTLAQKEQVSSDHLSKAIEEQLAALGHIESARAHATLLGYPSLTDALATYWDLAKSLALHVLQHGKQTHREEWSARLAELHKSRQEIDLELSRFYTALSSKP